MVLRNPAPPHVPIDRVLSQLENFMSNALGLKVYNEGNVLKAVGQVVTAPQAQAVFPANPREMAPPENVPVMVEAQFYPDVQTTEFRLSLRAANNKPVATPILAFIKFYMNV